MSPKAPAKRPKAPAGEGARRAPGRTASPRVPGPFTVFLDRDGVFDIPPRTTLWRYRSFRWIPGAKQAIARLNRPNIRVCLATNQPYVGCGLLPARMLARLHEAMKADLERAGGRLDRVEVAYRPPFWPNRRRKPNPGLLEDGAAALAAAGWAFSKERAVMVGDRVTDALAAKRFGIKAILLATVDDEATLRRQADAAGLGDVPIAPSVDVAVEWILAEAA